MYEFFFSFPLPRFVAHHKCSEDFIIVIYFFASPKK